jgi:hypothetical protein
MLLVVFLFFTHIHSCTFPTHRITYFYARNSLSRNKKCDTFFDGKGQVGSPVHFRASPSSFNKKKCQDWELIYKMDFFEKGFPCKKQHRIVMTLMFIFCQKADTSLVNFIKKINQWHDNL